MIFTILSNLLRLLLFPLHALRKARAAPAGAYVALELDGPVVDMPRPTGWLRLFRPARHAAVSVARVKELARALALDPRVRGLLVHVRHLQAGPAVLASLRDVLAEVRAAGKDLVVHLPLGADNGSLYLASAARLVVVGPETSVSPLGFAVHGRYVRRALELVGVEPEVFARGAYKSAGEVLVRDTMSEAQREQVGAVLEARHDALVKALSQGRRVDRETAARWIDEAPHGARRAVELGIVDAVAYDDDLDRHLQHEQGEASAEPSRAPIVAAERYLRARKATDFRAPARRPVIGVIEVHGPIVARRRFSLVPVAAEDAIIATLRAAGASRSVRGVVLHIDSPGGSALASDRIHHEVERLAEKKPVVAYLSNVAASGGYYVAAAAHTVVAQPQTVTGSIGVVAARFVVGPLLERLGVFTDVVKRGARADLFSTSRRLDEGDRAAFERELDTFYQAFLRAVAKGRQQTVEAIEPLAGGRVYSGTEAHARGLVDRLGGFDRAVHELRELVGEGASHLEPTLLRAPRTPLPPPPKLDVAQTVLHGIFSALALEGLLTASSVAMETSGERVLAYWSGSEDEITGD